MLYDTIIVDGKTIPWLIVERGFKIPSFNFSIESEEVPGRSGSVFKRRNLDEYSFELPLIVLNDYLSSGGEKDHDTILHELTRFFNHNKEVTLQFKSKDWYWNAYFEGPIELNKTPDGFIQFDITVVLVDPYKYAVTGNKNTAISDKVSLVNTGTADTPVIVEARALKDSTNFMIAKDNKNYFMIGKSEDSNKVNKDIEPYLFNDELDIVGFQNWTYMPNDTSFGNLLDGGDAIGGRFSLFPPLRQSIYPTEWGSNTKTNWHGPALYRSLGKSIQDFRVMFKVLIRQYNGPGPGKAVTYIVDENNRTMFSMAYINTSVSTNNSKIIVYAYNEHGEARQIYSRRTPYQYNDIDFLHVFMYLERKGNQIKITNFKYNTDVDPLRKVPLDKDTVVVNDSGNFYQRPVRIARMYVGKSASHSRHMTCNIMGYSIQELLPKQSDITPIVIRKGDFILIDTHTNSATINGEDALPLKDFASNYFNIDAGHTELVVHPPETFDTTVKWQDRFL